MMPGLLKAGRISTGIRIRETIPRTRNSRAATITACGFLSANRTIPIVVILPSAWESSSLPRSSLPLAAARSPAQFPDRLSVGQTRKMTRDDLLLTAERQPVVLVPALGPSLDHLDPVALALAGLDGGPHRLAVLQQVAEGRFALRQNRRGGECRDLDRIDAQHRRHIHP